MKKIILLSLALAATLLTGCDIDNSGYLTPNSPIDLAVDGYAVSAVLPATLDMTWVAPDADMSLSGDGYEIYMKHMKIRADAERGVSAENNDSAIGYDGTVSIDDVWKDDGWQEGVWMEVEVEAWEVQTKGGPSFLDLYVGWMSEEGRFIPFLNFVGEERDFWVQGNAIDEDRNVLPNSVKVDLASEFAEELLF